MKSRLQKLLDYPHREVFDTSADAELALRVNKAGGLSWSVFEGVLTLVASGQTTTYQLKNYTISGLATILQSHGFDVPFINPDWSGLSALALVERSNNQDNSNGDHLTVYTSMLWALYSAYAVQANDADYQIGQAIRQMIISQAEGEWLDVWGSLYGVPRPDGKVDSEYSQLIPEEAFRIRVNALAIEKAIKDILGLDIIIDEPWKRMFILDESTLSGPDHLANENYYNFHVIQPIGPPGTDWPPILEIINRNRPAGVVVYQPRYSKAISHMIYGDVNIYFTQHSKRSTGSLYEDRPLLDFMNIEDVAILYGASIHRRKVRHLSYSRVRSQPWGKFNWRTGGTWKTSDILVFTKHTRDYRVYYTGARYSSQPWTVVKTWSDKESWGSVSALIGTIHTRHT